MTIAFVAGYFTVRLSMRLAYRSMPLHDYESLTKAIYLDPRALPLISALRACGQDLPRSGGADRLPTGTEFEPLDVMEADRRRWKHTCTGCYNLVEPARPTGARPPLTLALDDVIGFFQVFFAGVRNRADDAAFESIVDVLAADGRTAEVMRAVGPHLLPMAGPRLEPVEQGCVGALRRLW